MSGGRESILRAAIQLFAQKGYAGTSTREICDSAGITKPVLYYHFKSKEHLYRELMAQIFREDLDGLVAAAQSEGSLRNRLIHMVSSEFRNAKADPTRVQFVLRMIFSPEEQLPNFNAVGEMERQRVVLSRMFREAIDAGEAEGAPEELATALIGLNLISILEHQFTGRPTLTRRRAEHNVDFVLRNCRVG